MAVNSQGRAHVEQSLLEVCFLTRFGHSGRSQKVQPQLGSRRTGSGSKQIHCYRGIRLNDEYAAEVYKIDRDMAELMGCECYEAVARDAADWPIPRDGHEDDVASVLR